MSLFNAMSSSISGMSAQSQKMGKIADNIANSSTVGYKRGFVDLVTLTATSSGGASTNAPSNVRTVGKTDVLKQGGFQSTTNSTDMSIIGEGMFVVGKNPNETAISNFGLTRAGAFQKDENGLLQNSAGQFLYGFPLDANGNAGAVDRASFKDLRPVNIGDVDTTGQATTNIEYQANLPSQQTGLATAPDPFVTSVEYYTELGEAERLSFSWQPTTTDNMWTLTVSDNDGNALGSVDATFNDSGPNAGTPASFTNVTNLAAAPAAFGFNPATGEASLTLDNATTPQNITVQMGAPGTDANLTQFAGDYTPGAMPRDGYEASLMTDVEISDSGIVYGLFENGSRKALYQVPVGTVVNYSGLVPSDGNTFKVTADAGQFSLLNPNEAGAGYLVGNSLERSNVDLAEELTGLIETQRSYSSNATVTRTTDEMLQETVSIKR